MLSSIFLFANCSLINDKYFSKSYKDSNDKSEEQEIVKEKVYIEDEKEEKKMRNKTRELFKLVFPERMLADSCNY